ILLSAIEQNNSEIVHALLTDPYSKDRIDPSFPDNYPLIKIIHTVSDGDTEVLAELLKDPRVDPTVNDNEPLALASIYENIHSDVLKLLLQDSRIDPTSRGNNLILEVT